MAETSPAPQATRLRLSRYHCFVGELLRSESAPRLTSREMADELGVSEETVRRDLSYVDVEGRPGAGYDPADLFEALEAYLGLCDSYPFVAVGDRGMLQALRVIFPAEDYGLRAVAYFSPREEDSGHQIDGVTLHALADIAPVVATSGATVALIACEQDRVQESLERLHRAGIRSALMLTPMLRPRHPDGMDVSYFRIPCALKALAGTAPPSADGCATPESCEKKTCCRG